LAEHRTCKKQSTALLDGANASHLADMRFSANVCSALWTAAAGKRTHAAVFKQWLDQPQFQIGPIGVRVQQGPKLPPL
jgi:hypothetical protein